MTQPHRLQHKPTTQMETTNSNIERRSITGTVELRIEDGQTWPSEVTGIAAVVNERTDIGWFEEEIAPGAFDNALKNSDIRVLGNHDPNIVLGRNTSGTAKVWVNDSGQLAYSFTPDEGNPTHVTWVRSIQRGDITQSSFAFTIQRTEWLYSDKYGDMGTRRILEVRALYDVSPVTYPAYAGTSIAARDMDAIKQERAALQAESDESATAAQAQTEAKNQIKQTLLNSIK